MALDDFDDRFAAAVKTALGASRSSGSDHADASEGAECPSPDMIASYYEYALNRVERARLESHFSGCARCQGTLAALLRAAPTIDTASEAGGFAAAAAHTAAAQSDGIRERWFEISPSWRIAGVTAAATAMLAVVVVAGLHVYHGGYQNRIGKTSEQVAALSATPRRHPKKSRLPSSVTELALNDNKSMVSGSAAEPRAAAPSAATAAPGVKARDTFGATSVIAPPVSTGRPSAEAGSGGTAGETAGRTAGTTTAFSNTPASAPAQAALPAQEPPPVAAANGEQDEATAATAAQAAAALGALAAAPAPAATAAPAESSAAAAPSAASSAPATPASKIVAPAATAASSGIVNRKQELAALAGPPSLRHERMTTPEPAQPGKSQLAKDQIAKDQLNAEAARKAEQAKRDAEAAHKAKAAREAETARQAEAARKAEQAKRDAEAAQKAKAAREAETARQAEVARKAEQARRDANLKRQLDRARRDAQAKSNQIAAAAPQPQRETGSASAGGNAIAMADRPVASAPMVAAVAPGIPIAPHAILISSPDHSVYWSLQNSGVIYRTNDRKSWTPQYLGVQADLLAGMAPTDTVCWAVGRKGVILLTTDGTHWERVKSPTTSDVTGITAASKDVATIFTASGVMYSTFDGGSNWEQAN
ncbi:MAG TPA: YCF48-related protein [Candidatus Binataceae bacterium]|nr:YCF48-related protein [Candidatus Binataceae bacterium]